MTWQYLRLTVFQDRLKEESELAVALVVAFTFLKSAATVCDGLQ